MRFAHFERFRPLCPQCRLTGQSDQPLVIATAVSKSGNELREGVLHCSHSACQMEYPVIDGVPIIVPDIRSFISDCLNHIIARSDLSELVESMLADCAGPGTHYDTIRQHLGIYAWDHYRDLCEPGDVSRDSGSPSVVDCLEAGLGLATEPLAGPALDLGCSVGRTTFELAARTGDLTLGIDTNFSMLRLAQSVARGEECHFPLRRSGVVYDRISLNPDPDGSQLADFWACDALALPFSESQFGLVTALNVLDCVSSPVQLLQSLEYFLAESGQAVLACPYDWSPSATPFEGWIGGHSQRSETGGSPEPLLRALLTPGRHPMSVRGLQITGEIVDHEWVVRNHDRSRTVYSSHIVAVKNAPVSGAPG